MENLFKSVLLQIHSNPSQEFACRNSSFLFSYLPSTAPGLYGCLWIARTDSPKGFAGCPSLTVVLTKEHPKVSPGYRGGLSLVYSSLWNLNLQPTFYKGLKSGEVQKVTAQPLIEIYLKSYENTYKNFLRRGRINLEDIYLSGFWLEELSEKYPLLKRKFARIKNMAPSLLESGFTCEGEPGFEIELRKKILPHLKPVYFVLDDDFEKDLDFSACLFALLLFSRWVLTKEEAQASISYFLFFLKSEDLYTEDDIVYTSQHLKIFSKKTFLSYLRQLNKWKEHQKITSPPTPPEKASSLHQKFLEVLSLLNPAFRPNTSQLYKWAKTSSEKEFYSKILSHAVKKALLYLLKTKYSESSSYTYLKESQKKGFGWLLQKVDCSWEKLADLVFEREVKLDSDQKVKLLKMSVSKMFNLV